VVLVVDVGSSMTTLRPLADVPRSGPVLVMPMSTFDPQRGLPAGHEGDGAMFWRVYGVATLARSTLLAIAVISLLPFAASSQETSLGSTAQRFDGVWWAKAGDDEKIGFLYALEDCFTFDAKPGLDFDGTWVGDVDRINDFYRSTGEGSKLVQDVFKRYGKTQTASPREPMYGNEFWRAHKDEARRGFIEGYVSCRASIDHVLRWSKPALYYVSALNDLYNVDDRFGESGLEYSGAVASALEKLCDH